jgi:hypothetical protein
MKYLLGIILLSSIALFGCGGGDNTTTSAGPTVTTTKTITVSPEPTATVTKTKTVTAKPPSPKSDITEGIWIVGEDIKSGTYRTIDAVQDGCYWEIDRKAGSDDIVQNDLPTGGHPTVNLRTGQQFITKDCGDWTRS